MSSKEEINKYLTEELFGECWHHLCLRSDYPRDSLVQYCTKCKEDYVSNNDFFTWEGFGKLWEKVEEQKWCSNFIWHKEPFTKELKAASGPSMTIYDINPERFATAVYEFLKENN